MGLYLNSKRPKNNYLEIVKSDYFVDKTSMLEELFPIIGGGENTIPGTNGQTGQSNKYICITRPRRFGKTVIANMIAAFFEKRTDSHGIFNGLRISECRQYQNHINQHNVIYISLNECPDECRTYRQYISRIKKRLMSDLIHEFPNAHIYPDDALWDAFNNIYELEEDVKFIFVLDEWDFIFHRSFVTEADKQDYISFLSNLLKDTGWLRNPTGCLRQLFQVIQRQCLRYWNLLNLTEDKGCHTTASIKILSPSRISFTPIVFFWLKLKLSI